MIEQVRGTGVSSLADSFNFENRKNLRFFCYIKIFFDNLIIKYLWHLTLIFLSVFILTFIVSKSR